MEAALYFTSTASIHCDIAGFYSWLNALINIRFNGDHTSLFDFIEMYVKWELFSILPTGL